jgi:hypothetical protein
MSMNTHQVLITLVVDTRVLCCVADLLQERRLASISPTYYKDTKTNIFFSEVIGISTGEVYCSMRGNATLEHFEVTTRPSNSLLSAQRS